MKIKITPTRIVLLLIVLLAATLRLYALTLHSMWWDEMLCMFIANPKNAGSEISGLCKSLYHTAPPAFYVVLNLWMKVFGYTDASARALVALFGIAGTGAMYLLGKELFNKSTALIAALITAINYWHLYYSLDVHYYSLLFLMSTLSFTYFTRLLKGYHLLNLILYVVCTWILIIVHHFSLLLPVAQGLIWFALTYKSLFTAHWKKSITVPVAFVMVALLYLPFLPNFLHTLTLVNIDLPQPGSLFFLNYFHGYFGYSGVGGYVAALALLLFVVSSYLTPDASAHKYYHNEAAFIIGAWLLLPLVIGYLRSIMASTAIIDRYTIVILPALLMAVAAGINAVKRPLHRYSFLFLFLASGAATLSEQKFFTPSIKDDFKGAAEFVRNHNKQSTFHVVSDKNWCFKYYFDQYHINPVYIEKTGEADERFYLSNRLYENQLVVIDTTLKDVWVVSAHFKNLNAMHQLCNAMMQSDRFILKDSFEGRDAFARHFIRKY